MCPIASVIVPIFWVAVAWGVFQSPSFPSAPIELLVVAVGGLVVYIMLCLSICFALMCLCCICSDTGGRLVCCNCGGRVEQGRYPRIWVDDELIHEEIVQ